MIDQHVMEIADAARDGQAPLRDDVLYLLQFDGYSVEAAYVCARARDLGREACGGIGLIEAQIGVDAMPCPGNCLYCSLSAVNTGAEDTGGFEGFELTPDQVAHYARIFDQHGVHLISLMSTAGLPFDRYLDMVRAARAAIADDALILANTADMTLDQALALKEAGANLAYHNCRCGEGYLTGLDPQARYQTMRNIKQAGMGLMTGIEPLWMEVDHDELADKILEIPGLEPFATGACGLSNVEGSALLATGGMYTPALRGFVKYVGAIVRLVCGTVVPFGGIGAAIWVDAGCDPRARKKGSDEEAIARDIRHARRELTLDGWMVPDRPIPLG